MVKVSPTASVPDEVICSAPVITRTRHSTTKPAAA